MSHFNLMLVFQPHAGVPTSCLFKYEAERGFKRNKIEHNLSYGNKLYNLRSGHLELHCVLDTVLEGTV